MSDNCYVCGRTAHDECAACGQLVCKKHCKKLDGVYLCLDCIETVESEDSFDDESEDFYLEDDFSDDD